MTREAHCRGSRIGCARIWIKQAVRLPLQRRPLTEFAARISSMHQCTKAGNFFL
jgi:hypothetical protein